MKFEIIPTPDFERKFRRLSKKHRSIKQDLLEFIESLASNPYQGVELSPGIRKIRMAISSKGQGKSGGARVITYTLIVNESEGEIYLMDIYDKSAYSTVDVEVIKRLIKELEL